MAICIGSFLMCIQNISDLGQEAFIGVTFSNRMNGLVLMHWAQAA